MLKHKRTTCHNLHYVCCHTQPVWRYFESKNPANNVSYALVWLKSRNFVNTLKFSISRLHKDVKSLKKKSDKLNHSIPLLHVYTSIQNRHSSLSNRIDIEGPTIGPYNTYFFKGDIQWQKLVLSSDVNMTHMCAYHFILRFTWTNLCRLKKL